MSVIISDFREQGWPGSGCGCGSMEPNKHWGRPAQEQGQRTELAAGHAADKFSWVSWPSIMPVHIL